MSVPASDGAHADTTALAYDTYRYENHPVTETHPAWLQALARLQGVDAAAPDRARVLELGCGRGGNLVALAAVLPDAELVGVDLSPSHVDEARATAAALGLANVRFEAMDIADVPASWGAFDYVLCHGVYSWVPARVRARILEICGGQLAPPGVAYVSYNTLPGWHARGMIRGVLRRFVTVGEPAERVAAARELLEAWLPSVPSAAALRPWLEGELALLSRLSDRYLFFEHLVEENTAFHLADVVADAASAGLRYLGDAEPSMSHPDRLPAEAAGALERFGTDAVAREQFIDLATMCCFRRSLFTRADAPVTERDAASTLEGAWVRAISEDDTVELEGEVEISLNDDREVVIATGDPHGNALAVLLAEGRPWPQPFPALVAEAAERTGMEPTDGFTDTFADRVVEQVRRGRAAVGWWTPPVAAEVESRPVAFALARHQAGQHLGWVTNLWHERIGVDHLDELLLTRCDGRHDLEDLRAATEAAIAARDLVILRDEEPLDDPVALGGVLAARLARLALDAVLVSTVRS